MLGIFDSLFDYNGDGKLDSFERTMKWASINMAIDHVKKAGNSEGYTEDTCAGDFGTGGNGGKTSGNNTLNNENHLQDELELYGIDASEFEWMDEYEQKEALEDAGLDPWDYGLY